MTLKRRKGTQPVVERREHRAEHVMSHASSKVWAWTHPTHRQHLAPQDAV